MPSLRPHRAIVFLFLGLTTLALPSVQGSGQPTVSGPDLSIHGWSAALLIAVAVTGAFALLLATRWVGIHVARLLAPYLGP